MMLTSRTLSQRFKTTIGRAFEMRTLERLRQFGEATHVAGDYDILYKGRFKIECKCTQLILRTGTRKNVDGSDALGRRRVGRWVVNPEKHEALCADGDFFYALGIAVDEHPLDDIWFVRGRDVHMRGNIIYMSTLYDEAMMTFKEFVFGELDV